MKTGCCLLLLATPDDPLARRAVPLAGQSGYDYAEVSLARLLLLDARDTAPSWWPSRWGPASSR